MPDTTPDLKQDESWHPRANIFFCSIIHEWEHSVFGFRTRSVPRLKISRIALSSGERGIKMASTPKPAQTAPETEETYEEWFDRQVDQALVEADSPDAVWVSHDEIQRDVQRRREEFLARMRKNA
jgi:hypothetical protein